MHDQLEVDPDISALVQRARTGDQEAARLIIERFGPELITLVRARLPRKLRKVFDSGDAMQEVWRSFLCPKRGVLEADVPPSDQIRVYLMKMVMNRVTEEHRKFTQTQKYDLEKERPLVHTEGHTVTQYDPPSPDPSPSEVLQGVDRYVLLTKGRTPAELRMIDARRDGLTYVQIAEELGLSERTVRRFFTELKEEMGLRS